MDPSIHDKTRARPRRLLVALTAAMVAACSADDKTADSGEEAEGIGYGRLDPVGGSAEAALPVDATPSPDGSQVYFLAFASVTDADGLETTRVPAVYRAVPGGAAVKLHEGPPLLSPFGITISDDGQTLFLADSSADQDDSEDGAERSDGRVFAMPVMGGTPTALAGTEGLRPTGLEASGDALYVTGVKAGVPGLYRTGLAGGGLQAVATGTPLLDPGGVAVTREGDAYVVDTGSEGAEGVALASVVKVSRDGKIEVVADGLTVGHPAGIALVHDESAVLVSGFDGAEGTDRVFRVDLADRKVRRFGGPIAGFADSAGLHRARQVDVFAWADSQANGTGTVYVLRP